MSECVCVGTIDRRLALFIAMVPCASSLALFASAFRPKTEKVGLKTEQKKEERSGEKQFNHLPDLSSTSHNI